MEELKKLLEDVCDTYNDFVRGVLASAKGNEEIQKKITQFIVEHPDVTSSEIIEYLDILEGGSLKAYGTDSDNKTGSYQIGC